MEFEDISKKILAAFDEKTQKREELIKTGRDLLRLSKLSIKKIHNNDLDKSRILLDQAKDIFEKINSIIKSYPDIDSSSAPKEEYAEARLFYSLFCKRKLLSPEDIGIDYPIYLNGLADVIGEFRRKTLDSLLNGDFKSPKDYFKIMNEIYDFICLFDHPKAITYGLRRKQDIARGIIEKTRSELTIASIENRIYQNKD